jgi:hypothetical protein
MESGSGLDSGDKMTQVCEPGAGMHEQTLAR